MRKIKFRVWDNVVNCMYTPDMDANMWRIKDAMNGVLIYPDGILMQFTGLLDKNGKEIYEGDKVRVKTMDSDKIGRFFIKTLLPEYIGGFIVWNERQCKFQIDFEKNKEGLISCEIGWGNEDFEVIGNIHENPELLTP